MAEQLQQFVFKIFNSAGKLSIYFYDYIRNLKPCSIRYLKNISLLITSMCIIAAVIVISRPQNNTMNGVPVQTEPGGSYNKKVDNQKDKQNSVLRRFIS